MTKEEFRKSCALKTNEQLKTLKKSIANNPSNIKREEQLEIIKEIIGEDDENSQKTDYPFDVKLAMKYTNKYIDAKERGLEFTLSLSDMRRLLTKKRCYYTGIILTDNGIEPSKRTLDRKNNTKGYTPENTVACCHAANRLKAITIEATTHDTAITKEQFKRMAKIL